MIPVKVVLAKDPACSANWAKGVIINENGRSEPIKYNALDGDRYGYVSKTISEVI